ncbi:MAG: ABC transporter ATP-binding protein [Opitutia bacterium Tous-C1TDCM]|nr:MAG: ABC transporter ATP-binding protein [Opitutae bacterium Tous-C1TDCM]
MADPVSGTTVAAAPAAIELRGLVKDFAVGLRGVKLRAVDHVDLRVEAGTIYGLLGPNGSGKSTTIKLLLGLLEPTAGTCAVFGVPSTDVAARAAVGYLPEAPYFYRHLTGRELVRFYGRLSGLGGRDLEARSGEVLATVGMVEAADRRVGTYSKGMLQRIGLAQALVHDPQLLILDEPTAGVDPVGSAAMAELILGLKARGKTVLITSHLLGQIEDLCDRVAMLDRGRLVLEGAVRDLVGRPDRQALVVDALPEAELAELKAWLAAKGRRLEAVETPRSRLDRVFLDRVQRRDPSP